MQSAAGRCALQHACCAACARVAPGEVPHLWRRALLDGHHARPARHARLRLAAPQHHLAQLRLGQVRGVQVTLQARAAGRGAYQCLSTCLIKPPLPHAVTRSQDGAPCNTCPECEWVLHCNTYHLWAAAMPSSPPSLPLAAHTPHLLYEALEERVAQRDVQRDDPRVGRVLVQLGGLHVRKC